MLTLIGLNQLGLSMSFAPDGVDVAGEPNQLDQTMEIAPRDYAERSPIAELARAVEQDVDSLPSLVEDADYNTTLVDHA